MRYYAIWLLTALGVVAWPAACAASSPVAPLGPKAVESARTPLATADASPPDAAAAEPPDATIVDVRIDAIRSGRSGRTSALHELSPTSAYALVVHTPSTEDVRYFRHASMLDVLFHPHDPAPGILYVFSSPSQLLEHPDGRHAHQVRAEDSRELGARRGEFAILLLDAHGRVLGTWSEPVERSAIHELIHYRDRVPAQPDPALPPRP